MHQRRRRVKDSLSNKIQTVWVSDYAVWANKCTSNISRINQSCVVWSSEWVCYSVSRQHIDIFWKQERSWKTSQENSEKISRKESLSQVRKMWISQTTSQISRTHYHDRKIENKFRKNQNNNKILNVRMHQKYINISKINKILLKIHYKLCQHYCITHQLIKKR